MISTLCGGHSHEYAHRHKTWDLLIEGDLEIIITKRFGREFCQVEAREAAF